MTRAEAIESAAVAIHKVDGNAVPWEMEEDWMRDDYVKEATAALDALLEAGMTFGEETPLDVLCQPHRSHRPQGESK